MPTEAKPQLFVKRILVPTDFSAGAEPALVWAAKLAEVFACETVLLHVLDVRLAAFAGLSADVAAMPAVDELLQNARAAAQRDLQEVARRFPHARTVLKEGAPRHEILESAKSEAVDLIVMGTHGRSGLSHVFFGSVAEDVVRQSHVPVLTARERRNL